MIKQIKTWMAKRKKYNSRFKRIDRAFQKIFATAPTVGTSSEDEIRRWLRNSERVQNLHDRWFPEIAKKVKEMDEYFKKHYPTPYDKET